VDAILPYVVLAAGLALTMGLFAGLARRARRRGVAGAAIRAALASWEEVWRSTSYRSHHEIQAQSRRRTPIPAPGTPEPPP
jgi:hypothetical protein